MLPCGKFGHFQYGFAKIAIEKLWGNLQLSKISYNLTYEESKVQFLEKYAEYPATYIYYV